MDAGGGHASRWHPFGGRVVTRTSGLVQRVTGLKHGRNSSVTARA